MAFLAKVQKSLDDSIGQFCIAFVKKVTSDEKHITFSKIIGAIGVCIFIFGILVQTTIFPSMLESRLQEEVALTQGTYKRGMWAKWPFPYDLRVYVFNVTNPDGIAKGEKPVLKEIGPFVYDVWHEKVNLVDDDENDTVTYSVDNAYFFNAEKSNNLSDTMELTLASFLTFSTANVGMKDYAALISVTSKAVDSIGRDPTSLFLKEPLKNFLFLGEDYDCRGSTEFGAKILCKNIRDHYRDFRMGKKAEDVHYYSVFGGLNETNLYHGRNRIRRGTNSLTEVGEVLEYNGSKNMSTWKNDDCDRFRGTEGTMFHPHLNKKKDKYLYVANTYFCRTFAYEYDSTVKYKGLKLLRYTTSVGTAMETDETQKCYCISPDRCLKDGVYEIFRCFQNAFILSNPHFYLAHPSYIDTIDGVSKPTKDEHMVILDVDPLTGVAVRSHFRVQYNLMLMHLPKYRLMKDVRDAMFPLIWADEVTVLPDFMIKRIKKIYRNIMIAKVVSYLSILMGLAMCGYALYYEYKLRNKK